ncbi:MAG: C39 family peptidase [Ardenticatenales bacterium]
MCALRRSAWIGLALSLIADLGIAAGLAAGVAAAPAGQAAPVPLPVPYIPQIFNQSRCTCSCNGLACPTSCQRTNFNGHNNCGPAAMAMLVEANGRRPPALADRDFVAQLRQAMTGQQDGPCNPPTDWPEIDKGAAAFGLCARDHAKDIGAIQAMTERCLPVIALVSTSPHSFPGLDNPEFHRDQSGTFHDHFIVIVGFSGDTVSYLNPLVFPVPNRGNALRTTSRATMISALQNAQLGDFGRGYGDPIGGCDGVGRCNQSASGSGSGAGAPSGPPAPVFDRIQLSLGHDCSDRRIAIYFKRPEHGSFNERRKVTLEAHPSPGRYVTHVVEMPAIKGWSGTIDAVRIDPVDNHGDNSCLFGLSYALFKSDKDVTGRFYPFYEHAGDIGRPLGRLLGWNARTDRLRDLGPCCEPNGGPRRSWLFEVIGDDPWLENDHVDLVTGRD